MSERAPTSPGQTVVARCPTPSCGAILLTRQGDELHAKGRIPKITLSATDTPLTLAPHVQCPRCIPGSPEVLQAMAKRLEAQGCTFRYQEPGVDGRAYLWLGCVPKAARPVCGARTRKGTECQARCTVNGSRCRLHGGLSTGPKTEAEREAMRQSNRRRGALQA